MGELRAILPYFKPYRKVFRWGLFLVLLANIFQVAGPFLIKLAIDGLQAPDVDRIRIASFAATLILFAILGGVARYGMRELLNGMSRRIECDLRNDFFQHLLSLDATFYGRTRTGDLMSRATNDTLAVRMAVGPAIMYTVNTAASFIFTLALMIWISPRLTLYAMIPMLALPPIVIVFGRMIHNRFEEIQKQFASLSAFVQDNLTGVRIVRAYTQEKEQERQFDAHNEHYRTRNMDLALTAGAFHPVLVTLAGLALVFVTWIGALEVIAGTISIGDYVAFGLYVALLVWPMISLGWVVNLYQRGAASMGRLNKILATKASVAIPKQPRSLLSAKGKIEFCDVSFVYPDTDRTVLDHVNFIAYPGATIAIVGPTGSGKSTLIALLARIYDPTNGTILFDEIPLTELDPSEVKAKIGMVPQDPFLFSDTIENNISMGSDNGFAEPDHDGISDITYATKMAQLHEQITEFPNGYETVLGERGINLSGGQKQRATLARALARDPLVLVLDDALSAVDTHTETQILDDLQEIMSGRTSFIISHRVSAVMRADKILVLDEGVIVESGTHAELIATNGTYTGLLRRQLLEEGLEAAVAATANA